MLKNTFKILLILCFSALTMVGANAQSKLRGRISITGAFAMYPMVVRWAEEFKKIHPQVKIDISAGGAGKGITDVLSNLVDIGMVSREVYPEEIRKGAYAIAVAKDAVLVIVNTQNPEFANIMKKGLTPATMQSIWISGAVKRWDDIYKGGKKAGLHAYTRSDACGAAETWAHFFNKKQEDLLGIAVFGDPGLALAVQKDKLGIGFNNLGYAYDLDTRRPMKNLAVVPFDINGNGTIDKDEDFYHTLDQLTEAVANDKYPTPPARNLYFVTKGKPQSLVVREFLKWIFADGQKFVNESGLIKLKNDKIAVEKNKIN